MSFPSLGSLFAGFLCLSAFAFPARAGEFTAPQKSEIESIVHSYLLGHPEILREVATELEKKQQQEETDLHRDDHREEQGRAVPLALQRRGRQSGRQDHPGRVLRL